MTAQIAQFEKDYEHKTHKNKSQYNIKPRAHTVSKYLRTRQAAVRSLLNSIFAWRRRDGAAAIGQRGGVASLSLLSLVQLNVAFAPGHHRARKMPMVHNRHVQTDGAWPDHQTHKSLPK